MKRSSCIISILLLLPLFVSLSEVLAETSDSILKTESVQSSPVDTLKKYTSDELAQFDGKNGRPVYVAVDDTVYDLTGIKKWKNGTHNGNKAGNDLSDKIKKSPHGKGILKGKKVAGILIKK